MSNDVAHVTQPRIIREIEEEKASTVTINLSLLVNIRCTSCSSNIAEKRTLIVAWKRLVSVDDRYSLRETENQ
jgi:hypothetical protein